MLHLAIHIGDFLADENDRGNYSSRYDSDWDTYMWLEAYRLLKNELGEERRKRWGKAIVENIQLVETLLEKYQNYPWYNAPFITTSPNHYSIYAGVVLLGGRVFNKPEWEALATKVFRRFCMREQTPDGYWGEQSQMGPTTGYNYVTVTQVSLYYEYTKDPEALKALRRSTDFHKFFTYPDGTPVETINDRNRDWGVSVWGQFGFSLFDDGRRYAEFLISHRPLVADSVAYGGDIQTLGRVAQDLIYYHTGPVGTIPQDQQEFAHQMKIPAGIRKTGPWEVTYSGIIAPQVTLNNFFLDRQSNLSVFNTKTGLIITGANSKRQPWLATFTEKIGQDSIHMPVGSQLRMGRNDDTLSLAYNVFFASIDVPKPAEKKLSLNVRIFYKWGEASNEMHLQLVLKNGQELTTGSGKKIVLGDSRIELGDEELDGSLTHNGWTMRVPQGAHLSWPVYPFNPYKDAPETDISKAIGLLTMPLQLKNENFSFDIEVE